MPFCTACGREMAASQKFCAYCGAPNRSSENPSPQNGRDVPESTAGKAGSPSPGTPIKTIRMIVIAALALLVILAGAYFLALPLFSGRDRSAPLGPVPTTPASVAETAQPSPGITDTPVSPLPAADPFPKALPLKSWYDFSSGATASQGTVYRYWINTTYQWHSDLDNRWYTQEPKAGHKYLFVFADMVNRGQTRVWYPKSNSISVHFNGSLYAVDPSHYIPEKSGGNSKAKPLEIAEVQYWQDLFRTEYVEDYGLSHGTKSDFVYPGESNAVDGYLIYEVPASLVPDKTYVEIIFNNDQRAVWKLA